MEKVEANVFSRDSCALDVLCQGSKKEVSDITIRVQEQQAEQKSFSAGQAICPNIVCFLNSVRRAMLDKASAFMSSPSKELETG